MVSRSKVAHVLSATSSKGNHMIDSISTTMTTDVAHIRGSEDATVTLLPLASTESISHSVGPLAR